MRMQYCTKITSVQGGLCHFFKYLFFKHQELILTLNVQHLSSEFPIEYENFLKKITPK